MMTLFSLTCLKYKHSPLMVFPCTISTARTLKTIVLRIDILNSLQHLKKKCGNVDSKNFVFAFFHKKNGKKAINFPRWDYFGIGNERRDHGNEIWTYWLNITDILPFWSLFTATPVSQKSALALWLQQKAMKDVGEPWRPLNMFLLLTNWHHRAWLRKLKTHFPFPFGQEYPHLAIWDFQNKGRVLSNEMLEGVLFWW